MAIRSITKKEEVVYKLLEPHSSGRQHNFDCEDFEWDEARYKYRSWLRRRNLGSFYVASKDLELCKKEVPELLPKLEAFAQATQNLKKAQDQFEQYRWELIKAGKSLCKDHRAVHRAYNLLTSQEELLYAEYKANPSKVQDLLSKIETLTKELDAVPKGRANAQKRRELNSELDQLRKIYHIIL